MTFFSSALAIEGAALCGFLVALRSDLLRRRLVLAGASRLRLLSLLDLACPALVMGLAAGLLAALLPVVISREVIPIASPAGLGGLASLAIFAVLWSEGRRQIQFQRPRGIIFGEWLILGGVCLLLAGALSRKVPGLPHGVGVRVFGGVAAVLGGAVIAALVRPFVKRYEGLHILDRVAENGETVQTEYTPPTPECPHPELWTMVDSQTSEVEVLDFLHSIVLTVKPRLVVETGTFLGHATVKMADALRKNGFGKLITIEYDVAIFAQAGKRIQNSGLGKWIESRNESSLEAEVEGTIDLLYSDSHLATREQEIRRFLPQLDPRGLLIVHDASSHFQVVREAALRLEKEGLISVVLLSTPRGIVLAQKRQGRV